MSILAETIEAAITRKLGYRGSIAWQERTVTTRAFPIEKGATIPMAVSQVWKSSKFAIERNQGKTAGTIIFRLSGPFTARDMHGALSPNELRNTFESEDGEARHALHILDLTEVPYMDSAGLGLIVSHYVRCQGRGVRLILAGVSPRVVQLLEMTTVDKFFPRVATVEDADRP